MGLPDPVVTPLRVVADVRDIDRLEPLDRYQIELTTAISELLADGLDVLEITRVVAHVNDVLTIRLLEVAEGGLGPPPVRYAWLALGSHGRGEQVLSSDQDSALAFGAPPAGGAGNADEYFRRLAELVVPALARAGFRLCSGGYMATSWRYPIERFRSLFHGWVERPEPGALLEAEIFLDVRPVHGVLPVDELGRILVTAGGRGQFLAQMARAALRFGPRFGLLGRLPARSRTIDVKRGAIAAIVLLARLYALAAGSSAGTTPLRLDAAAAAGTLSRAGARELIEGYRFLTELRLRHQLQQFRCGEPADNLVPLDDLTTAQRSRLIEVLHNVRDMQAVTATRFATHTTM